MADRSDPVCGMVLFEQRMVDSSSLAANDGSATGSSYSQAGSRPGRVAPVDGQTLVPALTGGQGDETVTLRVERGGYAGRVGMVYSIDGATYRGWMAPRLCDFEALYLLWGTTDYVVHSTVTIPSTQKLVTIYAEYDTGTLESQARSATAWAAAGQVSSNAVRAATLFITPDESRLIALVVSGSNQLATAYSEDDGATWDTLSRAADVALTLPGTPDANQVAVGCFIGDDMVAFIGQSTGTVYQVASADGGISWTLVATLTRWKRVSVSGRGSRAILVGIATADNDFEAVQLTSAFVAADQAPRVNISTTIGDQGAVSVLWDADGVIYTYSTEPSAPDTHWFESYDDGLTWSDVDATVVYDTEGTGCSPQKQQLVSQNGEIWSICNWSTSPTTYEDSLTATRLTQWSGIEITGTPVATWVPMVLPPVLGNVTLTGANAGTLSSARHFIDAASGQGYSRYTGSGTSLTPGVHFIMSVSSGGSITSDDVTVNLFACNAATADYQVRIRFGTSGFRVVDITGGAATLATVVVDMTLEREFVFGFTSNGVLFLAHKIPEDSDWEVVSLGSPTNGAGGGAAFLVDWGCRTVGAGSGISLWRMVSVYGDVGSVLTGTSLLGKRITGSPYPLADVADADGIVGQLSVRGGAGLPGEVYTIAPEWDYALTNALPGVSPSPYASEWRSKDTSEQVITFDLTNRTYLGGALALLLQRVNFQTAYLEYYDGAVWQTIATYNGASGFENIEYDRTGETIFVSATSDPSDRPLHENEFGDGYSWVNLASTDQRKILDNTGGWWVYDSTTVQASINLQGITGSESASDSFDLVAGGGLLIAYPTARIVRRRWRVRIPSQDCPDSFFRAGLIGPGRFVPFAQPWAWGATMTLEGLYESFVDDGGAETRARRGEGFPESWTLNWSGGVPEIDYYADAVAPYVGVSGAVPLEIVGSVLPQLRGMVSRTRGQTLPFVAVSKAPTASGTITDRQLYLYGYPASSVSASLAAGREGESGVQRIETLRVDAVVG